MNTRILTIWMPPASPYSEVKSTLYCICGVTIKSAQAFTIEEYEFEYIGTRHCGTLRCLACSLKIYEVDSLEDKIREITREELKRIFREEIADPNGEFGQNKKEVPF